MNDHATWFSGGPQFELLPVPRMPFSLRVSSPTQPIKNKRSVSTIKEACFIFYIGFRVRPGVVTIQFHHIWSSCA
jgi:hypothetical protein